MMELRRKRSNININIIITFLLLLLPLVSCNGVFRVHHKFYGKQTSLGELKDHDSHRHRRLLSAIDFQLGGDGNPGSSGLYYAKIGLGSPSKDYFVQVDTGSDLLWVNCIQCTTCHKKSGLDIKLTLYDPKASSTGQVVDCDSDFCSTVFDGSPVCTDNKLCQYRVRYADGSQTDGYYVQDLLQYTQATGNGVGSPGNGSVVFGCGAKQSGDLGNSNQALDGIIGFGQANSSVISQLASAGKVKKVFSHCLDGQNGGGIFAIGEVVQPKVKSTPLVPNQQHYNVNLKEIEVGKDILDIPSDIFETDDRRGTIIDSGTTLAYLPNVIYSPLIQAILSHQPDLSIVLVEDQFQCFEYSGSVDDGFPTVTFHFEGSISLTVPPHEYIFSTQSSGKKLHCIGWQNGGLQAKDGRDLILLGDIVLSNKLFIYDLENQVIGWTEYNCSSSIKLLDSGSSYTVGAHDLSLAWRRDMGGSLIFLLLSSVLHTIFF